MFNLKKNTWVTLFLAFMIVTGCQQNAEETENPILTQTSSQKPVNQSIANEAVRRTLEREEVTKANGVNSDKLLIVAFDVEHFERFNIRKIEKKIQSKLKKDFTDVKVKVTYDEKIMQEIEQLQVKIHEGDMSEKKLKKELSRIKKLMNEKT